MKTLNIPLICFVMVTVSAFAEEVPKELVEGLASEQFKQREATQVEIEKWADAKGPAALAAIFKLYVSSDDPEIRNRCHRFLRNQSDKDYLNDGQGYLGVHLLEVMLEIAGEDKPRFGIQIRGVVDGGQAEIAGIKVGDIIASIDGKKWHEPGAMDDLRNTIKSYKPKRKVLVEVKRQQNDKLIEIPVILGKRPVNDLDAYNPFDIEQAEKDAKEKHFNEWLEKLKQNNAL